MKKLGSLNFSNDNKLLEFLSEDKEIFFVANSKQEALKALTDMACNKSISAEELTSFQKTILEKEEFPWLEENKEYGSINPKWAKEMIGDEIFELLTSIESFGMIGLLVNPLQGISSFYPSSFLPCNCDEQRGIIWTEIGLTTILSSKEEARCLLNAIEKIGGIDVNEINQIKQQIDLYYKKEES